MNISKLFILRPVATSMLMAGILLAATVAYRQLPGSALPQVDYPTIQVLTFYPGASPDVMASAVTAPLERQFGQVPGLKQMTSTSSFGSSVITLQFALDLDIDVAEQEVQAAINAAATYLPRDLPNPPIYSKTNPADAPVLTLALTSQTLPLSKVQDLADTRLVQKISQLSGVGLVTISGGQKPAVRIRANPTALAAYGLGLEDVRSAIAQANVNQAKGNFDAALGPGGGPDRPHDDDPGLGPGREVRADADRGARRDGAVPLPAQPEGHHHSERGGPAVARRHVRRDVPARFQPGQPVSHGAHHLDRFRRRRRDRDDRE